MLEEILRQSLPLDETALRRFRRYYELLTEWNAVMNLTAISGEEDTARLHFLDCAALAELVDLSGKRVIDVGTGAGFPGMVLKILRPETELTLLDSLDKRLRFLSTVCGELGFADVQCLHARAEEAPPELRQSFDVACSRLCKGGRRLRGHEGSGAHGGAAGGGKGHPAPGRRSGAGGGIRRPRHGAAPQRGAHPQSIRNAEKISPQVGTDEKESSLMFVKEDPFSRKE